MILSPSFLSCDFNKLKAEILSIKTAKWLHFDVMDGLFVKNYTYDEKIVWEIKGYSKQFFDVHLMIKEPEKHFIKYIEAGADLLTFHLEATKDSFSLLKKIRAHDIKAGISIKPETKVESLDSLLPELDLVLIMSVEPGAGGQRFLEKSLNKISYLKQKRQDLGLSFLIEVDGGINLETAKLVKEAGADVIVVGSFLFKAKNREELIEELENV